MNTDSERIDWLDKNFDRLHLLGMGSGDLRSKIDNAIEKSIVLDAIPKHCCGLSGFAESYGVCPACSFGNLYKLTSDWSVVSREDDSKISVEDVQTFIKNFKYEII